MRLRGVDHVRGAPREAPVWTADTARLRQRLRAIRHAAWIRSGWLTAWDATLGALFVVLAGIAVAAWTLRGDLAGPWSRGIACALVLLWIAVAVVRTRRRWRDPLTTAAELGRVTPDGPLRRLWYEVRAALELEAWPQPQHSVELRRAYIADVTARTARARIAPRAALPPPSTAIRVTCTAVAALAVALAASSPRFVAGAVLWMHAQDARPPQPQPPIWSSLRIELRDPAYTGRAPRSVPNPSGALRVLAGTTLAIEMHSPRATEAARVVVAYDPTELGAAPAPEVFDLVRDSDGAWRGAATIRGSGSWAIVLPDDEALEDAARRSPAMPIELEPDRPPEVELLPLPQAQREVDERNTVDLRFHARDDFGIASATLVVQLPSGEAHRLPIPLDDGPRRTLRMRYAWDISRVPVAQRSEVLYWIEVRDNDPGLGLVALPDPPGKLTRSAVMQLTIRDDESEHSQNIEDLAALRDAAVDLLADRMTTEAFTPQPAEHDGGMALDLRLAAARDLLGAAQGVLSGLAAAIEALALDTLSAPRDAETLSAIHGRLMRLHREELALHEAVPVGVEMVAPERIEPVLRRLGPHNREEIEQLEDEIIRLDDLVDGQVIRRIETLVARLEVTQRKLVDELEQLKAGDASARARIEQLQQRRRDDMRRLAEARAMLRKEVEHEFMNLDAFAILEEIARDEDLGRMLEQGKVDDALERMRGELGELQSLRDRVQQQIGIGDEGGSAVSKEEQQRMQLLRELSRLQDEEAALRRRTRALHETWRGIAGREIADPDLRTDTGRVAQGLRKNLEAINDARLGRDARRGLEDAIAALERLERDAEREEVSQLELVEGMKTADEGLERALAGAEATETEGRALRRAAQRLEQVERAARRGLPEPGQVLPEAELEQLAELQQRQRGVADRRHALAEGPLAPLLPAPGRKALRRAGQAMERSNTELGGRAPEGALRSQEDAWNALQEAIDSLRQGSPPPPPQASRGEASTEAERDRSLRDALLDAMRETPPDRLDAPIQRYYEELLR